MYIRLNDFMYIVFFFVEEEEGIIVFVKLKKRLVYGFYSYFDVKKVCRLFCELFLMNIF